MDQSFNNNNNLNNLNSTNNEIGNNQPLNNNNYEQPQQVNPNIVQQPVEQINAQINPNSQPQYVEQPVQSMPQQPIIQEQPMNKSEGGGANNDSFNSKPPKKKSLGLIIGIAVIAILIIAIGVGIFAFKDKIFSNGKEVTSKDNNVKKELIYTNFSESRDENNIAIPLRWGSGHYVVKLNGEGFGKPYTKKYEKVEDTNTYTLSNDSYKILSYFNAKSDPSFRVFGLWGYGYMEFKIEKYNETFINGSTEYISYKTVAKDNNYYLVSTKWNNSDDVSYYIKIVLDDDVVNIYLGYVEESVAKEIFKQFVDNSEIVYIPLDDEWNVLPAVEYENGTGNIDVSSWTFLQSLISDVYQQKGIRIQNTTNIQTFNSTAYQLKGSNAIYYYTPFNINNEKYIAGIIIRETSEETVNQALDPTNQTESLKKVYSTRKDIDCSAFKNTYLFESSREATIYVQTDKDKYFILDTGITYDSTSDSDVKKIQDILEQIFN